MSQKRKRNESIQPQVKGYDFNEGVNYSKLLEPYIKSRNLDSAIEEINRMLDIRSQPLTEEELDNDETDEFIRRKHKCTIFLGFDSNLLCTGLRETLRYLVQHKMVDCVVTTAGGVEDDFTKCLAPTSELPIRDLRYESENYIKFKNWVMPLLDEMLQEQILRGTHWSMSQIIHRLGERINDPSSFCYWAAKNNIPVICSAYGCLVDIIANHSIANPGLIINLLPDSIRLRKMAVKSIKSGMILIGGDYICGAVSPLIRFGVHYSVLINTGLDYNVDEIRKIVCGEIVLIFPFIVAETFAKRLNEN